MVGGDFLMIIIGTQFNDKKLDVQYIFLHK